jgi:hypothetical protein
MIYIATAFHGRGVKEINAFDDKFDFWDYACNIMSCQETTLLVSDKISDICGKLYDTGMGSGARHHYRVSRVDAIKHIENGAKAFGCSSLIYNNLWGK